MKVLNEAVAGVTIGFSHPSCKYAPQCGVPPILMQLFVLVQYEMCFEVETFFKCNSELLGFRRVIAQMNQGCA